MSKKFTKILISGIILLSTNAFGGAYGAVLDNAKLNKIIYEKVYLQTQNNLKDYSNDFKISITGVPRENYSTSGNFIPKVEVVSQNNNFQPNSYKRVFIKDAGNNVIKAFPINVQTLVYKNVLVAKNPISYGKEIISADVTIERKEISNCLDNVVTEYKSGLVSARNFQKGNVIKTNYLKEKTAVTKNSIVEIIFISKSLRITLQGKALKDGAIGDLIPVRSDKYNKIYTGKVNSQNEIIVRI